MKWCPETSSGPAEPRLPALICEKKFSSCDGQAKGKPEMPAQNRYSSIIQSIFASKYTAGAESVDFERQDLTLAADELGIKLPANPGDILYSFRFRTEMPPDVSGTAPEGFAWIIRLVGRSRYRFDLVKDQPIVPNEQMLATKVPEATPGIIAKYALSDEQALLAKVRYNRLIDVFTGITCYSLQNHLRTAVAGKGQIETDEIYVGVDRRGAQYVIPVQAKGGTDKLSIVQIEQDLALCAARFPDLIAKPIACQFLQNNVIVLFEFSESADGVGIVAERHYHLVPPDDVTPEDLRGYRTQA
jgi:hypothetical protein